MLNLSSNNTGDGSGGLYVSYTSPQLDEAYVSVPFEQTNMLDTSAYPVTKTFIDLILAGPVLPQSVRETFDLDDIEQFVDALLDEWNVVITYNWQICTLVVLGFIMTLIMPLVGIAWCILHCRGRCGGGRKMWRNGWETAVGRQVALTFYFGLWGLSLFGLFWHFAANQLMADGFSELPDKISFVVEDTQRYVNNTILEVEHWTEVNFGEELLGGYIDGIDKFAADMNFALENPDDGMYSDRATRFVSALEITYKLVEEVGRFDREDRDIMLNYTQTLLDLAVPVSELLNELMDPAKWTDVLRACGSQCDQMQFLLSTIELNLDQISSPDVIRNIIISNEEFATLDRMLEIVQEMDVNMHELADGFIYANEDKFTNLLDQLDAFFRDGSDTFKAVINNLVFSKNELGEDTEELTELFFKIAYYTFLVPSIVLVFVLFFYICGFVMGLCAPIGSDLRLNGARMIYAGTILFLTFSLLMWLLTTLLFVSGSALDKLYCDTVENPADAELYNVLEDDLNELLRNVFNNSDMSHVSWSVPEMLEQCQDDKSLYMILKLNESYDVRQLLEWRSHLDTESTLTTLTSLFNLRASQIAPLIQIDETTDPTLREDMLAIQDKLTPLVDDFLYDFYDGEEQISFDNVIRVDSFQALYDSLVHLGAVDTDDEAFADGLEDLTDLAGQLNSLIPAFRSLFEETTEYAFSYYQRIHMETAGGYIYKNIGTLVSETQPNGYLYETPRAILDNIDIMLEELTTDYTDLLELFDWFADYSVTLFEQELGSCEPMYEVYEAGVHYSCHDVVDALNCMWSGLGIVLVCSIPLLVCAVKVEGAYRTLRGDEEVADAPVNIFRESMTKISLGNDSLNSGAGQRIPSIKLIAEQGQS